jgi:hypothetical protein
MQPGGGAAGSSDAVGASEATTDGLVVTANGEEARLMAVLNQRVKDFYIEETGGGASQELCVRLVVEMRHEKSAGTEGKGQWRVVSSLASLKGLDRSGHGESAASEPEFSDGSESNSVEDELLPPTAVSGVARDTRRKA